MDKPARKNFDKKVHMHIACVKNNDQRKIMSCVYFKDGFAYATDGIVLVKNRLSEMSTFNEAEIAALDGKFLPAEHYKDILKYDECLISEEGIEASKGDDRSFFYFKDFGEEKFPKADEVLQNALNKMTVPLPQVRFNIKHMARMAKALCNFESCTATFKGTNEPIVFYSNMPDVSSEGILMPVWIDEKEAAHE